jgi:hypothetical protein
LGLSLKSLLPIAGAAAGFFLGPAGNAAVTAALGSGIGTLLGGGDIKDAVKNAALAGAAGAGLGAMSLTSGAAGAAGASAAAQQTAGQAALTKGGVELGVGDMVAQQAASPAARSAAAAEGIGKLLTPGNLILGSSLLAAAEEPEQLEMTAEEREMFRTNERNPGYKGQVIPAYDYSRSYADGGYIQGPGTGRSDSVKAGIFQNGVPVQEARLSDGEFVFTERAVRGLGNGDRSKGAAKMYEMMRQYERMA